MTPSSPSQAAVLARDALRGSARDAIVKGYRLDARSIDESAGQGVERVQRLLGPGAWGEAGWPLLMAGVMLMRGDDERSVAHALAGDPMMAAGMSFGAFLGATVGELLLREREERGAVTPDAVAEWQPPEGGDAVLAQAAAGSSAVIAAAVPEQAARRLTADVITRLKDEVSGIDETIAGWALSIVGAWLSAEAPQAARAIGRSRVLGRPNANAQTGCALTGALLAHIGAALLSDRDIRP